MHEIDCRMFAQLLVGHPLLCLSTRRGRINNLIPLTWYMPTSQNPPLLSFLLQRTSFSHEILRETSDCAIGVPDLSILRELHYCGLHTGRDIEKLRLLELSTSRAFKVSPLLITSCLAHLECEVWDIQEIGDRITYIVCVIYLTVDEIAWDGSKWTDEAELVYHLAGHTYRCKDKFIDLTEYRFFK